jgi:hypothetical protein
MEMKPPLPFMMRLFGFTHEPQIGSAVWRMMMMKSKPEVRAYVDKLATLPGLARLVPSHGAIVGDDAAGALRRAAARL